MDENLTSLPRNFWQELISARNSHPDGIALISEEGVKTTFSDLVNYVDKAAADLRKGGLQPGDRVALVTDNGPHAVTAFLTIFRVCACYPQNPSTGYEWDYEMTVEGIVAEEDHDYDEPDSDADGASGTEFWTFEAINSGNTEIIMEYAPPGAGDTEDSWALVMTVTVE